MTGAAPGTRLRALGQLHEHPAVVAWWAARIAPLAAWLDPGRRRLLLALAAVPVGVEQITDRGSRESWLAVPLVFALLYAAWLAARHLRALPAAIRNRPQVALHAVFAVVLLAIWTSPAGTLRRLLVAVAAVMPFLLWRVGYMLKSGQRGKAAGTRFADHLFYLWPLWGGTNTPYGKGLDALAPTEAKTAEALARSQLAGLKLLVLALAWRGAIHLMRAGVYAEPDAPLTPLLRGWTLGVPHLMDAMAAPGRAPVVAAWASIYAELVWSTLRLAAKGHVVIGVLRLCGFNAFRNTYKPLLAESVVEFWNRYYYYFKELLVEFFFFPTFVRRFRRSPRARIVAATFAAAFAGNLYYHAIEQPALLPGNLAGTWAVLHSRVFYCVLLAAGISVSMLREQRRRGAQTLPAGGAARLVRIAGVWTFFSLIHIWALPGAEPDFTTRVRFFLSLFRLT